MSIKIVQLNNKYADYWKKNGVEEGSIITAINDIKIKTIDDAQNILKNRSSNESLRIELINTHGEKERYNFR